MQAKDARITWNDGGPVHVSPIERPDAHRDDRYSDGACYRLWREQSNDRSLELLTEVFARVVIGHGCDPKQVSEAFGIITGWGNWLKTFDRGGER